MNRPLLLFCSLVPLCLLSQPDPYDVLSLGSYSVGTSDTILYNEQSNYTGYGYSGAAPLFVRYWFPQDKSLLGEGLTLAGFRQTMQEDLSPVFHQLNTAIDSSFVNYYLREDFPDYQNIDYSPHSLKDVLLACKQFKSRSQPAKPRNLHECPLIVYHHGSQGSREENFLMAEYFASRGYVFVSADFHLPYEDALFGLTEGLSGNTVNAERLIAFARSLSPGQPLFYIGHSWGAQIGWLLLHKSSVAEGFISLETTLEFKKDEEKIRELWPHLYQTIRIQNLQYSLPVLMIANTMDDKPFEFFSGNGRQISFVSAREMFGHESYTSFFYLRYFLRDLFPQSDTETLHGQFLLYRKHLRLMEQYMEAIRAGSDFQPEPFRETFYIGILDK